MPNMSYCINRKIKFITGIRERLTKTNEVKTRLEKKISAGNTELFNLRKGIKKRRKL